MRLRHASLQRRLVLSPLHTWLVVSISTPVKWTPSLAAALPEHQRLQCQQGQHRLKILVFLLFLLFLVLSSTI